MKTTAYFCSDDGRVITIAIVVDGEVEPINFLKIYEAVTCYQLFY
jgi:hypothetical protein